MRLISSIMSILTPAQRRRYLLLQGYFVFAAIVQVVGVVSVAPFIALVSNPAIIHKHALTQSLYTMLQATSDTRFLIYFAFALMFLIVASNTVVAIATWLIVSFSLRIGVEIQKDIFHGFLHRDYVELSRTNSGTLVNVISADAPRFIYMVLQPLLNLISQAIIVSLIVAGLVWYNFWVALFAGIVVGGGYGAVFFILRRRLVTHGRIAWAAYQGRQRLLTESLGGIKEIRLVGTEHLYEERLNDFTRDGLRSDTVIGLLGDLPKFILESIAFCALLGLGAYLLSVANQPQDVVGILSLYAMAGYKLLPAAQNVFKSASQLRANASVIDELRPNILAGRAVLDGRLSRAAVIPMDVGDINWHDVWFTYPATDGPAIRGISLDIKRNSIAVLVGSSGAGKSTFADLLLGLLRPSQGTIRVGGKSITEHTPEWQRNLGYVPQHIFILDDTVAANIGFGSSTTIDAAKVRRAAALANIDRFVETLPGQYDYVVGEHGSLLSGGQRQRLGIARSLYHDAEVLVLDEATSALDTITEREILITLNDLKRDKTIIMIAHRLATIKSADQVIFIKDGTLAAAGTYDELMQSNEEFRAFIAAGTEEHTMPADRE